MAKASSSDDKVPAIHRLHLWQIQAFRDLLVVSAAFGLIWFGYALRAVTVPLLVALLLAYLFEPLIGWLVKQQRVQMSRMQAVTTLLVTVGAAVLVLLAVLIPLVIGQTSKFVLDIRDGTMQSRIANLSPYIPEGYREDFTALLELIPGNNEHLASELLEQLESADGDDRGDGENGTDGQGADAPGEDDQRGAVEQNEERQDNRAGVLTDDEIRAIVRDEYARLTDGSGGRTPAAGGLLNVARGGMDAIMGFIGGVVQVALLAFLIPFYFFFFSVWYPDVVRFGETLIPSRNKERTLGLLKRMDTVVAAFVRGRIVISLIMGVLLAFGWMICGVPYAIALGLLIGVFCAVPYLGGVGIPLAIGLLFFDYLSVPADERTLWLGWLGVILWPSLVFIIVQLIEGYALTPMIAGKATNLDPVTIIVVVLAGGSIMGVYGMLLAIPVAACGKILLTDVLFPKIDAWLKGEREDPLPIGRD